MRLTTALLFILAIGIPVCGQQDQGQQPAVGMGVAILSDTEGVDFGPYVSGLVADLQHNWKWAKPEWMDTRKLVVFISFQVQPGGSIWASDPIVERTSGEKTFDDAAIDAIHASNPFEPLPPEFHGAYLELRVGFFRRDKETILLIHFKSLDVIKLAKDQPLKAMVTYTVNDEQTLRSAWVRQREAGSFDNLGVNDFDVERLSILGPGYKGPFNEDTFRKCVGRYVLGWIGPSGRGVPFTGDPPHLTDVGFDAPSPLDTCDATDLF